MPKINLLYVVTKLELGGAQKQLLSLISCLDQEKFNLFLFTAPGGILFPEISSLKGITIKRSRFLERPLNPLKDFLALIEIYRFIKKNNIKIVHTHSSKAGILGRWAARLARTKHIIHTIHGWSFHDYQPFFMRKLFIFLERITAGFTHQLIVVSNHDRQKGLANRIGDAMKYTLIYYGINYAEFNKNGRTIKEKLGIEPQELVVTNISCFKPQKSPLDFVKLAYSVNQSITGVKFLLVGDGILRQKIKRLISRLNLKKRLILTGWRRDIPEILAATDVLVLTSLWEGLPIVALEAMAAGRPVVVTSTGGVKEVVTNGETGFIVQPGDMNSMCHRLTTLLKDESLREAMGEKTKNQTDDSFSLEKMVRKTQDLYENLIAQERSEDVN